MPAPGSHRSVRAGLPHTAPRIRDSLRDDIPRLAPVCATRWSFGEMAAEPDVSSIVPPNDSPIRHRLSGRALARAPVGGGFPVSPFRLRGGFTLPPWTTFPAALPGIPYVGLSPVRLQAPGTVKFSMEPSRPGVWVKSDPDIRHTPRRFAPAFGESPRSNGHSASVCGTWTIRDSTWAQRSSLKRSSVVPAVIASRPHPPV